MTALMTWLIFGAPALLIVTGCIADDYRTWRNRHARNS